ncbi:MAG: hypothetical protein Q8L15_09990 [Methylobacter sp.]|nr:hypothetical protein [Methylobacter sp.]
MDKAKRLITFTIFGMAILFSVPTFATEVDDSISSCLKAWGKHPFGNNLEYKTLATSVKVFGIGQNSTDSELTNSPSLVLVNPGVNVMGGTTIELLNPNGWYCLMSNTNVMGGLTIRAHCKAHLASATEGVTVLGASSDIKSVTVMGSTQIELVGCK